MKVLALFLFFVSFVAAFPTSPSDTRDIIDERPIPGRPVEGRPVEPNPVPLRPIGSRSLKSRQEVIPGAYIIEFKEGYTHDSFTEYLEESNIPYRYRAIYNSPKLFVGVSIQVENQTDYYKVSGWEGVANIWPVTIVRPPNTTDPVPEPEPVES